jgi:hypothetical protein
MFVFDYNGRVSEDRHKYRSQTETATSVFFVSSDGGSSGVRSESPAIEILHKKCDPKLSNLGLRVTNQECIGLDNLIDRLHII